MTVSALRAINLPAVDDVADDLSLVSSAYEKAEDDFRLGVANVISAGPYWTNGGQHDAVTVMGINVGALWLGHVQMAIAANALRALHAALGTAKPRLDAALAEARQLNMSVGDDGSINSFSSTVPGQETAVPAATGTFDPADDDFLVMEARIQGILEYVDIADATCAQLLHAVGGGTPQYATTADPAVSAANALAAADAFTNYTLSVQNLQFWQNVVPKARPVDRQPVDWLKILSGVLDIFIGSLTAVADGTLTAAYPAIGVRTLPIGLSGAIMAKDGVEEVVDGLGGEKLGDPAADDVQPPGAGKAPTSLAPDVGEPWAGSGMTTDQLKETAEAPYQGKLSAAGHVLDGLDGKTHPGFPVPTADDEANSETAAQVVDEILDDPMTKIVPITKGANAGGYYYVAPDGRGLTYAANGDLVGFGNFEY
jgi:hypothetical protein